MNKIHSGNIGVRNEEEIERLEKELHILGLPESAIESQLTRLNNSNNNEEILILDIIEHEFGFLLTHGYDLFDGLKFDWCGLDIKLKYIDPDNINLEHLTYVIEGYRHFLANKK